MKKVAEISPRARVDRILDRLAEIRADVEALAVHPFIDDDPPQPAVPRDAERLSFSGPFTPTSADRWRQPEVRVPAGRWSSMTAHLELTHGGWHGGKRYEVLWVVLGGNRDQLCYILLLPNGRIRVTHGMGLTAEEKFAVTLPFRVDKGDRLTFGYLYDAAAGTVRLEVAGSKSIVIEHPDPPNVSEIVTRHGERLIAHLSFDGARANEPSSLGWTYRNLEVVLQ